MTGTALLWMTHVWSDELKREFEKFLAIRYPESPDIWILSQADIASACNLAGHYCNCFKFDADALFRKLPYRKLEGKGLSHNTHFPLMDFFLNHPVYDYYWYVEFDVRYTGDWGTFLRQFNSCDDDLISCHIRNFSEEPAWYWWDSFRHPSKEIPREQCLRSFNVCFRISGRALGYLHEQMKDGWQGHCEVTFPTLLSHGGYRIRDFGGNGPYVYPGMVNRNYTSRAGKSGLLNPFSSVHWRPSQSRPGLRKNRIYHPVKPRDMTEPWHERLDYYKKWIGQCLDFR